MPERKMFEFECGCRWPIIKEFSDPNMLPLMDVDVGDLPDCPLTWEMIGRGDTKGIFQLESRLGQTWSRKLKPKNFEHMSALGALLRPGSLANKDADGISTTEHYCRRVNHEEPVESIHPVVDKVLEKTYGLNCYQESSMLLGKEIAGFDLKDVDKLRKCVTGDTKFVSKTRGFISIDTLVRDGYRDDEFLVIDDIGNKYWRKIKNIWTTGKKAVHDVETNSGNYVSATKYHGFLCSDGWKAKMRLKPKEDYMIACREVEFDGEDKIPLEECLLIAGLLTEGYFAENSRSHFTNFDEFMMNVFKNNYLLVFKQDPNMSKCGRVCYLSADSKRYLSQKVKCGLSASKEFPEVMLGATKETMRKFLSFALGAEGGVSESGQFEFSSKSRVMAHQVKLMLLRYGIRSNFCDRKVKGYDDTYYRLYVNCKNDQTKLLNELSEYWPEYKRSDLARIIGNKSDKNYTSDLIPQHIVKKLLDQYPWVGRNESGTLFTAPISRQRFERVVENSADEYWKKLANGSHCYEQLEGLTNRRSSVEVYDFTMDGDLPYIVANGMVIHNCIGKKDQAEMAIVKKMFLDGAKKTNAVPYEIAESIWAGIEKSGRYAFNKSHSMSYGVTGYQTAYLKTHFPIQYFTKWLEFSSEKIDPDIEKMELIEEAKKFDIKVNPPRIEFKKLTFHTDWKEIYFGLTDIKEIGEKAVNKLFEYLPDDVLGMDWNDWLYDVIPSNVSTMTKMISAGALDSIGMKRQRMLAELDVVADLTDKEIAWISENARDLKFTEALKLMAKPKKEGGGCANKNRIEKVKGHVSLLEDPPSPQDDAIPWLVWAEQKHLGVAVTCSKVESFVQEDVNSTCKDVQCGKIGMIVLGVEIMDFRAVKVKNGKSKGKEMAFLSVSDGTGTLNDVVCFADVWQDYRLFVSKGNTVYMQGERDPKNGSLIVRSISQLI